MKHHLMGFYLWWQCGPTAAVTTLMSHMTESGITHVYFSPLSHYVLRWVIQVLPLQVCDWLSVPPISWTSIYDWRCLTMTIVHWPNLDCNFLRSDRSHSAFFEPFVLSTRVDTSRLQEPTRKRIIELQGASRGSILPVPCSWRKTKSQVDGAQI